MCVIVFRWISKEIFVCVKHFVCRCFVWLLEAAAETETCWFALQQHKEAVRWMCGRAVWGDTTSASYCCCRVSVEGYRAEIIHQEFPWIFWCFFVAHTPAESTNRCLFKFISVSVDVVKDKGPTSAPLALRQHLLPRCEVSWISSHLWPTQSTIVNCVNCSFVKVSWAAVSDLQHTAFINGNLLRSARNSIIWLK